MTYVIDTSVISALHRNYYRDRFPTLWERIDALVDSGVLVSTREVFRELEDHEGLALQWAQTNRGMFSTPTADELRVVAQIFAVPHFQANVSKQKLLKGGRNADPFVIARAKVIDATVVTMEQFRPNAAKIPNICDYFGVRYLDLQGMMAAEGWIF